MTVPSIHIAYLALGSNLGDRAAIMRSAIESLKCTPRIEVVRVSRVIETPPVGVPGQGPYLNAAVAVKTDLSPVELLNVCLSIERAHGRVRNDHEKWGSRLLDIDVLLYGDKVIDDLGPPRLVVPHPHLTERLFALLPLAEIAAEVVHPITGLTIQCHLDRIRGHSRVEYDQPPACFQA